MLLVLKASQDLVFISLSVTTLSTIWALNMRNYWNLVRWYRQAFWRSSGYRLKNAPM
jgi:hypothetical protein